ncbi:DEAD/DEAH box helicase [Amycolatopsis sp. Hca4]|uniref:DEAD/DEAH box helicase n=1 Tax=Amycolatopsis sp. Hca4 TaxID=2742131 RepID=UPI00159296C7|nr:AAA domain-containing protein [Amycolatopsis sp. Hca4]QKV78172.1 AAA family ATPase [Amycolatopsis sp. Hca4]
MTDTNQRARNPWSHELRELLRTKCGVPRSGPVLALTAFSELDNRLAGVGMTRQTVIDELLQQGIFNVSMTEVDRRGHARFRMITKNMQIMLHQEPCRGERSPGELAVLDSARWHKSGPPSEWRFPTLPSEVTLHTPDRKVIYDLTPLGKQVRDRRRYEEAARTLTRVTLTPRRHTELRGKVRKQYGALRALLELSRQRAEENKAAGPAVVIDGEAWFGADDARARELVLRGNVAARLGGSAGSLITIRGADEGDSDAVRLILLEVVDDVMVLAWPTEPSQLAGLRRRFFPGREIRAEEANAFRYQRHLMAVRAFMDEEVVGNWTSLASLLCDVGNLAAPAGLPVISPKANRSLNDQQLRAVAGGMVAPHAYFVQGPPGTGKTQVITDVVSRLVEQGQRVLLTAPTHVAVDEVLSRLASEPGVLPLRLSYKDSLVATEAQRFTKRGYDALLTGSIHTPHRSKAAQWQSQLDHAVGERAALVEWRTVATQLRQAEERHHAAEASQTANNRGRAQEHHQRSVRMQQVRSAVSECATAIDQLRIAEIGVSYRLAAGSHNGSSIAPLLGWLGIGPAARLQHRLRSIRRRLHHATVAYTAAAERYDIELRSYHEAMSQLTQAARRDEDSVIAAAERARELRASRERAEQNLARHGPGVPPADLSTAEARIMDIDRECTRLRPLLAAQYRWFNLLGLTGQDERTDQEQAERVLRRALFSAVNLVCSTTTGFGGDPHFRGLDYDTLIVDEASKVTGAEFLIPARAARRWILIGDEKQLPPYVESADEHHIHALAALHLAERDSQTTISDAVSQLANLWKDDDDAGLHPFRIRNVDDIATRMIQDGSWPHIYRPTYAEQIRHIAHGTAQPEPTLLRSMREHLVTSLFERAVAEVVPELRSRLLYQQRMPAEIALLVKGPVYDDKYLTPDLMNHHPGPLLSAAFPTPVVFVDTSAQPDPWDENLGTSFVNPLEARWVASLCRQWEEDLRTIHPHGRVSISVLSLYAAQAKLIRTELGYPHYQGFSRLEFKLVDSVDRIQGQQSDIVIVSFCRTYGKPKNRSRRPRTDLKAPPEYGAWVQNINRLNVACTRARRSLVLLGHRPTLQALNGVAGAERFYHSMFSLSVNDGFTLRDDWVPGQEGTPR